MSVKRGNNDFNHSIDTMNRLDPDGAAWLRAWRHRCCPPLHILRGRNTHPLKRHLELCPWCRDERDMAPPALHVPAELSSYPHPDPAPGQIWSLAPELGNWGPKNRYYAPPLVLITALPDPVAVNVAQTCDDETFAGPDDLRLDNGLAGFAQPWNRYTLKRADLRICFGAVSEIMLARLRDAPPSAGPGCDIGSLRWFFRQMEVETGFFFSSAAVAELMTEHDPSAAQAEGEPSELGLRYRSSDELLDDLALLPLESIPPRSAALSLLENITRLTPGKEILPRAAAGNDMITALVFHIENGRIGEVETAQLQVTNRAVHGTRLHVSGRCPEMAPDSRFFFRLRCRDTVFMPLPGESGCEDQVFWAVFPVEHCENPMQGELIVRIFTPR